MPKKAKQTQAPSMTFSGTRAYPPTLILSSASNSSHSSSSSSTHSSSNPISQSQQRLQLRQALCAALLNLPEVLETILQFLSKQKLLQVRYVSRQWHACVNFVLQRDHALRWRPTLDKKTNEQLMLKIEEGKVQSIEIDFQNRRPDHYYESDLIAPWDTFDATFPTHHAVEQDPQTTLNDEDDDDDDDTEEEDFPEFDLFDRFVDRSMLDYMAEWIHLLAGEVMADRPFCLPDSPDEELEPEYAHLFDNAEIRKSPVKRLRLLRNRYFNEGNVVRALSYLTPQLTSLEMTFSDEADLCLDLPALFKVLPNLEHLVVAHTDENHQILDRSWYLSPYSPDDWHALAQGEDPDTLERLASTIVYPKIKSLHLHHAQGRTRYMHRLFSQLPNLQELTYTGSFELHDPSLYKILPEAMPHLRQLTFFSQSEPDLQEMLTHLPRLETLRLCRGSAVSASTIQRLQHHCRSLTTLDLTDATVQSFEPFSQAILAWLRSPTQRLKHLMAPQAVFLLEDVAGKQRQWHTGNLRTLVVRFDCTQERAPIHRIQYRPVPTYAARTFTHAPLPPKLNRATRQGGHHDPSLCSCLTPYSNNNNNNHARTADPHLNRTSSKSIYPTSCTLSSTPPPYRCEHSRTLFQFLSRHCPLLQSLRLQIHPQICMGPQGLRHLGTLQSLSDLHLIVTNFDRVKRRDLQWMMPPPTSPAASQALHGTAAANIVVPWPELKTVTMVVTRSIYHDCHLDAQRWIQELRPKVAVKIHHHPKAQL
ncbi:unnamed protein product [Mortierella alpina]